MILRGCGIHLKGTNVIIEIVEADKKPEIIDENEYCNIITKSDGVITKINVQNGTALVKVGDVVTPRNHFSRRMVRRKIYSNQICS